MLQTMRQERAAEWPNKTCGTIGWPMRSTPVIQVAAAIYKGGLRMRVAKIPKL